MYADALAQFPYNDTELPESCPISVYERITEQWKDDNRGRFLKVLRQNVTNLIETPGPDGKLRSVATALQEVVSRLPHPWCVAEDGLLGELRENFVI